MRILRILLLIFSLTSVAQAEIKLGLIPGGSPQKLSQQAKELGEELQVKLGVPVTIYISKDYLGLKKAFVEKKVDFAFFNPQVMVETEKEMPLKVLLKKVWKEPFYYSAIISKKSDKINSLQKIGNKKIVFVDKSSTSGYLYPMQKLKDEKIKLSEEQVIFSGNHQESIRMLESGQVQVAAVFSDDSKAHTGAWTQFSSKAEDYKVLWVSAPIPSDPLCVRQEFYDKSPKDVHALMYALIEILEDKQVSKKYDEVLGTAQLVPATSSHYESVRSVLNAMDLASKK